jgi:DNA-binding response OmpR family regulator
MNILILEDDSLLNSALSFSLANESHTVFSCFNGNEALTVLENERIDLITSDLMTPQKTGLNFLINLKKGVRFNIPIIIISGLVHAEKLVKQYELNHLAFFTKPVDTQKLLEFVNKMEH